MEEEFSIECHKSGDFSVRLGITLQMELDQYVEPIQDKPETYEREDKLYVLSAKQLYEWTCIARLKAEMYRQSADDDMALEHLGATYEDVHRIMKHEEPSFSGATKYEADEDLRFCYSRLAALYGLIFEAKMALAVQSHG